MTFDRRERPMKPIDDFEVLWHAEESRYGNAPGKIERGIPPQPRLRRTYPYWFGEHLALPVLLYKGDVINNLFIHGDYIAFQCETKSGYILITYATSNEFRNTFVNIYYILGDFSGAEWGEMLACWKPTFFERFKETYLGRAPEVHFDNPEDPNPLENVIIRDDRNLLFKIRWCGWYLLTLHEDEPRRFLFSDSSFNKHSTFWHKRYLKGIRLRSPPPEMPQPEISASAPPNSSFASTHQTEKHP